MSLKNLFFILFIFSCFECSAQQNNQVKKMIAGPQYNGSALRNIEVELTNGNKAALFEIAPYLDSAKSLTEFLGYHILQTPEKTIANRLLNENCSFLSSEIKLNDSVSTKQFLTFLHKCYSNIKFDNDANVFIITPFAERDTKYEVRELTPERKAEVKNKYEKLLALEWVKKNNINNLIEEKNPRALFEIAAALYRRHERFNYYAFNANEFIELLENLTDIEIGVEDEHHKIDFHIDKDFYPR
ncbi:MAG: hypothetical protein ACHQHN_19115, partial [Sphingobacteriales bacterium]